LISAGISLALLEELGFEFAGNSTLVPKLRSISPKGDTAMRDAVMTGIKIMLDLYNVLARLGTSQVWNYVHIVLTDGEDNSSKSSLHESLNVMNLISQKIHVHALKTYFIGVNVNSNNRALNDLQALANAGGENAEFFNISDVEISQIFEKIKVSLGILQRTQFVGVSNQQQSAFAVTQQNDAFLLFKEQKYVCLFTLDMSGSMSGNKWGKVCDSVASFLRYLGPKDLVAGIVFNQQALILLNKRPQYQPPNYNQQSYNNNYYNNQNTRGNNYNALPPPNNNRRNNTTAIIIIVIVFFIFIGAYSSR